MEIVGLNGVMASPLNNMNACFTFRNRTFAINVYIVHNGNMEILIVIINCLRLFTYIHIPDTKPTKLPTTRYPFLLSIPFFCRESFFCAQRETKKAQTISWLYNLYIVHKVQCSFHRQLEWKQFYWVLCKFLI